MAGALSAPSASPTAPAMSGWPEAKPTSMRASGPTSIAWPFQRGVLSQLYFASTSRWS